MCRARATPSQACRLARVGQIRTDFRAPCLRLKQKAARQTPRSLCSLASTPRFTFEEIESSRTEFPIAQQLQSGQEPATVLSIALVRVDDPLPLRLSQDRLEVFLRAI